ncbi:hypothetical protein AB833_18590 [Chromatiales bacterium (ex Bugula neritina AB1)]|nr:hypothetical protein AB833_18590 [Chromatiales bacterium (ex Bugula neritina AB1)]
MRIKPLISVAYLIAVPVVLLPVRAVDKVPADYGALISQLQLPIQHNARSLSENEDLLRTRSSGQLFRSNSLNTNNYSPQSIEISDSEPRALASTPIPGQGPGSSAAVEYVQADVKVQGVLSTTELLADLAVKDNTAEEATLAAQPSESPNDKEEVWAEISNAIASLNEMVGDKMFRGLRRTSENRMDVRLDTHYWRRVLYQTRVDLKNDISDIWHLYVLQYNNDNASSVFFIDDRTGKTIDIFTRTSGGNQ